MASYKIKSGDTLGKIAARNGMSVSELARLNGIADPNKIRAGQVIQLSAAAAPQSAPSTARQTTLDSLGASGGVRLSSGKTGAIDAQRTPSVDAMTQAILQSGASGLGAANDPRTSALSSPSFAFDLNPPNLPLNAPIAQGTGRYWGPNTDRWGPTSPSAVPAPSPQYAAMLQPAAYRVGQEAPFSVPTRATPIYPATPMRSEMPTAFHERLRTGAAAGDTSPNIQNVSGQSPEDAFRDSWQSPWVAGAPASGPASLQNASMFSDSLPSRSVQTVPIDPRTGNPIQAAAPAPSGLLQQGQAAYDARANAGQVQTPGLVDWGGIGKAISDTAGGVYDHFQGQYNQRQARDALAKSNSNYRQIPGAGNASPAALPSPPPPKVTFYAKDQIAQEDAARLGDIIGRMGGSSSPKPSPPVNPWASMASAGPMGLSPSAPMVPPSPVRVASNAQTYIPGPYSPPKTQDRLPQGIQPNMAYGPAAADPASVAAINGAVPMPRPRPEPPANPFGGAIATGSAGYQTHPTVPLAPTGPQVTDPWASLRYGIPATPRPGLVTSGVAPHPGGVLGFIGSLFGGDPSVPRVPGYNGKTSVTSNELAGANQGFGGNNALMPDSMNNSRWLTSY